MSRAATNLKLLMSAVIFLAACTDSGEKQRKERTSKGAQDSDANVEDGMLDPNDDKLPPDFTGDDPEKTEEDIKALLAECGGDDALSASPDKVIFERELKSLPIITVRQQPLIGTVTATSESTLDIRVTGATTEQTSKVTVRSLLPPLAATLGKATADAEAAANSGKATLVNVPFKEYATLNQYKQWEGVTCAFVPVKGIENLRGGKKTVAIFDQPIPSSISPKAAANRFKEEIGNKRTFSGIKIRISSSDNLDLRGKTEVTGTITVEKIESSTSVDDGKGGKLDIKGDIAFKITYALGDAKTTYALGFAPVVSYYISYAKKDLVANVIDTTAAGGGIAVFMHP